MKNFTFFFVFVQYQLHTLLCRANKVHTEHTNTRHCPTEHLYKTPVETYCLVIFPSDISISYQESIANY